MGECREVAILSRAMAELPAAAKLAPHSFWHPVCTSRGVTVTGLTLRPSASISEPIAGRGAVGSVAVRKIGKSTGTGFIRLQESTT